MIPRTPKIPEILLMTFKTYTVAPELNHGKIFYKVLELHHGGLGSWSQVLEIFEDRDQADVMAAQLTNKFLEENLETPEE